MATTYTVFSLGTGPTIDTTEGNTTAESADLLVGTTYGGVGNGLAGNAVTMTAPANLNSGVKGVYDQDNNPAETFFIDGVSHTFDAVAEYEATITYVDGTTAQITAVIFQDTNGNLYWAPELTFNTDQEAIEAKKILSLTLNSLVSNTSDGLIIDRYDSNPVPCFVAGTLIETVAGPKPIETLVVGDQLVVHDDAPQTIRWIGHQVVQAKGKLAPVRISAGALGHNTPNRDLLVSRQHRMLVSSKVCARMFGTHEVLLPAIKLTALPGIYEDTMMEEVAYYHIKTDSHCVVYAEGAPAETLLTGRFALAALGPDAVAELRAIFPQVFVADEVPVRVIADGKRAKNLLARHLSNDIPCLPTEHRNRSFH